ncbi:MAG: TonB-dependent receptor [candidate division Zixibacteria bacterium]|nr:TonB-dependent receptor [candidate division Zixibacteria bacterium]MDH3937169.1 TonB-dependent receptor [candidate division Zixibacteria bacterium]MDH4034163.1 TonB-dependent receptor [candidate division Zixibacteria bacterium]
MQHRPGAKVLLTVILTISLVKISASTNGAPVEPVDSLSLFAQPIEVEGMVIRANRIPLTELRIPAAATVVHLDDSQPTAMGTTGDLMARLPGLRAYPSGNRWGRANVDVRGFAGGGQAQYLKVTYDGIPINRVASGLVNWAALDPADLDRVEAINGPVSAQYGDFGFGGLLALTSSWLPDDRRAKVTASYGSFDAVAIHGQATHRFEEGRAHLTLSQKQSDGWRRHSRIRAEKVGVKVQHSLGHRGRLSALFNWAHTDEKVPGAVTQEQLDTDRTDAARDWAGTILPDQSDSKDILAGLAADFSLGTDHELKSQVYLTSSSGDRTVTIIRSVDSEPELLTVGADISLGMQKQLGDRSVHLVYGTTFEYGRLNSRWTEHLGTTTPGEVISSGTGKRSEVAGYAHCVFHPTAGFQVSLGLRVDYIKTEFKADPGLVQRANDTETNEHTAFSPKVAVGFEIAPTVTTYASVSGAFKSPTLLHLYDSPPFAVPPQVGGPWILISNRQLKPQEGTCYEAGIKWINNDTRLTAGYYFYDITNEIDFDLAKISYDNIGKSRHQGIELSYSQQLSSILSVHGSVATNLARFKGGDNDGNQINGVPTRQYSFGFKVEPVSAGYVSLRTVGQNLQYLDEANEHELDDYVTITLSAGYQYRALNIGVTVDNLFDREYSHDGYVDLFGYNRFYPAATRSVMVTVSGTL